MVVRSQRKAAFLDRDGVINVDHGYISRWEDFEFIPGALNAMRALKRAGFTLIIVTNQSGIARGYFTEERYQELTRTMELALASAGAEVEAVYHCPHHPAGVIRGLDIYCDCRKPSPGMILRARTELGLSLPNSFLVGDKRTDILAARAAGIGKAFILCADSPEKNSDLAGADKAYPDLETCVAALKLAP